MTLSLPYGTVIKADETVDPIAVQQNLVRLAQSVLDTGGLSLSLRCGFYGPVTVAAATTFTVPHGLGKVPKFVVGSAIGWVGYVGNQVPDAVNLNLYASAALAGNYVYWLAIG